MEDPHCKIKKKHRRLECKSSEELFLGEDVCTEVQNLVKNVPIYNNEYPKIESSSFYTEITNKYNGTTGSCSFIPPKDQTSSGCSFPPTLQLKNFKVQQRIIADYMSPHTPYRGVLTFHSLGSGKTLLSILVMSMYLKDDRSRIIMFVVKPSLKQNFLDELKKVDSETLFGEVLDTKERDNRIKRQIDLISYQELANRLKGFTAWDRDVNRIPSSHEGYGSLSYDTLQPDTDEFPLLNNTVIIIDEAHNLITPEESNYPPVQDSYVVIEALRRANNIKIVLMTATPFRNHPYEAGLLINMLKHRNDPSAFPEVTLPPQKILNTMVRILDKPKSKLLFEETYLVTKPDGRFLLQNQDDFLSRCKGYVSYFYNEDDLSLFPRKIFMDTQTVVYSETQFQRIQKQMKEDIRKFLNAYPDQRVTCRDKNVLNLCISLRKFSNSPYLTNSDMMKVIDEKTGERDLPRFYKIVENIENHVTEGKQFVYSFFETSGINIISYILQRKGWILYTGETLKAYVKNFNPHTIHHTFPPISGGVESTLSKSLPSHKAFVMLNSEDSSVLYNKLLVMGFFNMKSNRHGTLINLLLANKNYSEGISLKEVRVVHVTEPPTSTALTRQIIARAARFCSHQLLSFPKDWTLKIYNYKTSFTEKHQEQISSSIDYCTKKTKEECNDEQICVFHNDRCRIRDVDSIVEQMAVEESFVNLSFEKLLQQSAFDCSIFQNSKEALCVSSQSNSPTIHTSRKLCTAWKDEEQCSSHDECTWNRHVNTPYCSSKKFNRRRMSSARCDQYESSATCMNDPMCLWKFDESFINLKTRKQCMPRFASELTSSNSSCILLETHSRKQSFRLHRILPDNIKRSLDTFITNTKVSPFFYLIELLQISKLSREVIWSNKEKIKEMVHLHRKQQPHIWNAKEYQLLLLCLLEVMSESSPTSAQTTVQLWTTSNIYFSCHDTKTVHEPVELNYSFLIEDFSEEGDDEYLFSSFFDDASKINIHHMSHVYEIIKTIRIHDKNFLLQFLWNKSVLVKIIILVCSNDNIIPKNTYVSSMQIPSTTTRVYDKEECKQLWQKYLIPYPLTPSLYSSLNVASPVERLQISNCWMKWKYGHISYPEDWNKMGFKSYTCLQRNTNDMECETAQDCWNHAMTHCPSVTQKKNPFECTRLNTTFWKKKCKLN